MGANFREAEAQSLEARWEFTNMGILVNNQELILGVVHKAGFFDRLTIEQITAGAGGTSISYALKRKRQGVAAVDLLSTAGIITLASGAGALIETTKGREAIATPAGCTKPVFDLTKKRLLRGDVLYIVPTQTGAYAPFPNIVASVLYRPDL